jgi:P27 family predicted phage terminase small subunit
MSNSPAVPGDLDSTGKALYRKLREYLRGQSTWEDSDHYVLVQACRYEQRARLARSLMVDDEGRPTLSAKGYKGQLVQHPNFKTAEASERAFMEALRDLALTPRARKQLASRLARMTASSVGRLARPRVVSVCSSVGGMDLGFERAGFETVAFCEFDKWRRKVLAHHWPDVPCWPDLTTLDPAELPEADVLIGGTPCQDLSVAGHRAGLDGARSGLFFDYVRVRHARNIEWCVWENVAGALSSNGGLDFAFILGAFLGATVAVPAGGWTSAGVASGPFGGVCWRLLNAQHFGVPQRRRRVFVVGHLGGACPPSVLFESEGSERNPATRGAQGQVAADTFGVRIAGTLGAHKSGGYDETDFERNGGVYVAKTLTTSNQRLDLETETFITGNGETPDSNRMREADGVAGRLDDPEVALFNPYRTSVGPGKFVEGFKPDAVHDALTKNEPPKGRPVVVREGYGDAPNVCALDPLPDGRRYAACGDGVVAPVAEWVGRRLLKEIRRHP